jgi:hypothetical protein
VLRFLLDEHLRGVLWLAILRHNAQGGLPIDATRVGDPPDLPLGSSDPDILLWAQREDRILITQDVHTMPGFLAGHLQSGQHSPGVFDRATDRLPGTRGPRRGPGRLRKRRHLHSLTPRLSLEVERRTDLVD